jgi:Outer membrane protein beta-barrel domain
MMKKILILMMIISGLIVGPSLAAGFDADLTVGSNSIDGGLHVKRDLNNGFWRAGGSALYNDDDNKEYKWVTLDFTVGSETLVPGLTCDVGVKGILGKVEYDVYSGDVGAAAFTGRVGYLLPLPKSPVPIEFFAGFAYAPEIMSFRDTEEFMSYHVGVGVRLVQNASIILKYNSYDVDFKTQSHEWDLDDSNIRLGLAVQF